LCLDGWMGKLYSRIPGNIRLNQMAITGSHDSGTWGLDENSPLARDENLEEYETYLQDVQKVGTYLVDTGNYIVKVAKAAFMVPGHKELEKAGEKIRDFGNSLCRDPKEVISGWAHTQNGDLATQFLQRVRYFDLRVEYADGHFYFALGLRNVRETVPTALEYGALSVPEPVRRELLRVKEEFEHGSSLAEATRRLAERVNLQEGRILSEGLALVAEAGGPAATRLLEGTVAFLKERAFLRQRILACTADIRLGFLVSSLVPFGLAGFLSLTIPQYREAFTTTAGRIPLLLAVGLVLLGHLLIRHILRATENIL